MPRTIDEVVRSLTESIVFTYQKHGGEEMHKVRAATAEALKNALPAELDALGINKPKVIVRYIDKHLY